MVKRVRTLLRVSSRMQLHDNDIPVQRAEAEAYIKTHPDWEFDFEYVEKAVSAYHNGVDDREILQDIMRDAKNKEFDILLAYMSDRIGRQEEYSFYVAELNRLGIEVWTIKDGQLKTEEHIDKLLNYIRFWQNEGESKKTGMRVHDSLVEMVKNGRFVGGKAPYGYRLVLSGEISNHGRALHTLEIVPEHAEVVKKIYSYAINQGMGYVKIANALNEEKIPAPELPIWKPSTIQSILRNPVYTGYIAYDRRRGGRLGSTRLNREEWIYANEKRPEIEIVPMRIWERAQEIRESRKARMEKSKSEHYKQYEETYNIPFSTKGKLALTGMVYCGYCGKRLKNTSYMNKWTSKKTGEEKISYVGRYGCADKCKPRGSYSQEYLEPIVFGAVETYLEKLKRIDISQELKEMQKQSTQGLDKELKNLEKEKKNLEMDIKTLEDKIPDAIRGEFAFSAEKLSTMIAEKETQKKQIVEKIKTTKCKVNEMNIKQADLEQFIHTMPKWSELFAESDMQTKKMILSTLIDKIMVKDDSITIQFKINLEDYIEESLQKSVDRVVSKPGEEFYHNIVYSLRPEVELWQEHLQQY